MKVGPGCHKCFQEVRKCQLVITVRAKHHVGIYKYYLKSEKH